MSNRGPSVVLGGVQWGESRYPCLWVWEPYEEPKNGRYGEYWAFPLHRLYAYAHGIIDHPRFEDTGVIAIDEATGEVRMEPDGREVHHVDEDKMNSQPDNLEAHAPEAHGRITNGGKV